MEDRCFFQCKNDSPNLQNCGQQRIETIRNCSIRRGDGLFRKLSGLESIKCHKDCVSRYTSKHHMKRFLAKQTNVDQQHEDIIPHKITRRSEYPDFIFKEHCLFCGERCEPLNSKHPGRWRKVVQCQTADGFKQKILDICDIRKDAQAHDIRVRLSGAVSDLHAADAQYHDDCRKHFMNRRNVQAATTSATTTAHEANDPAFVALVKELSENKSRVWNSLEIKQKYRDHGGSITRQTGFKLLDELVDYFGGDLLILTGKGVASLLVFRSEAPNLLKLTEEIEDIDVSPIASSIKKECLAKTGDRNTYNTRLFQEEATEACSDLLLDLLAKLSPKLDHTNPALLIGNIITSIINNRPTTLQITLATMIREKTLVEQCTEFGITCSYDELLRFKKSVAHAASKENCIQGLMDSTVGLVQTVADNFDANISSPNGLKATHSMALLLTQVHKNTDISQHTDNNPTIRRLSKEELKTEQVPPVNVLRYNGPRKVNMPHAHRHVLPLRILAAQVISKNIAQHADFTFLCKVTSGDETPEYNGFNTARAREQGHSIRPCTKAVYTPLIDMKPSDPDTVMTAMAEAQRMTRETGQEVTLFTVDQQLYKVAVDILWAYPEQFHNFIPRLGGMHMLMSFIGSVGTLMNNSGLEEIMASTFGGIQKMLSGKKFPQNLRAMRLIVEELVRSIVITCETFSDLLSTLEDRASRSRTAKVWVNNLIKPVLIMMMFVRAEREADWPLHLAAVSAMIPYFFASAHFNYARYGLYYLRSMEALQGDVLQQFIQGNHVMRHNPGLWNGIWSDMFIESTFMRYGHEAGGLIGLTLQPSAVARWALSLHVCSQLRVDLASMKDGQNSKVMTEHKEESKSRIKSDTIDREKIKTTLSTFIDPLDPESHPDGLVNIANGLVSANRVNVDNALEIGQHQMNKFESGWPASFHQALKGSVTTMAENKKSLKIENTAIYDTELLFNRVIGLQQSRNLNIKEVLKHELSAVPPALFDENGDMRSQVKSTLKAKLQVEVSKRHISPPDAIIIDGCALLWTVHWPANGTVEDYINNFMQSLNYHLQKCPVNLIFDRYPQTSTKTATRSNRAGQNASRKHILSLSTPLPAQKVVLNVTHNKTQLISLITQYLVDHLVHHHELVITCEQPVPLMIRNGEVTARDDLRNTHEEADVIIIHQLVHLVRNGASNVCVVCDDTDVLILLVHFYCREKLDCSVTMQSPIAGRTIIDIKATAEKHKCIAHYLPGLHALSGCDTTSYIYGIGKATALKTLNSGKTLVLLGMEDASMDDVIIEATSFMSKCYGSQGEEMSDVRYAVWTTKMANLKLSSSPRLKSLPPTSEAFAEHVRRAHHQTMIWKSALCSSPPSRADPEEFGWIIVEGKLSPVILPVDASPAPADVLQMVKCGCASAEPCSTSRCSCVLSHMSCSVFCNCHAEPECNNIHTRATAHQDNDDA